MAFHTRGTCVIDVAGRCTRFSQLYLSLRASWFDSKAVTGTGARGPFALGLRHCQIEMCVGVGEDGEDGTVTVLRNGFPSHRKKATPREQV